ncbi:hypothetical protein FRC02_012275 [Tulasnella sp. 418]|nr:hypothetical protein FRC02_012275 [Tulasnella sp. 418]
MTIGKSRYGRNEILSAYVYSQTGIYRTPKQCGSKTQQVALHRDKLLALQCKGVSEPDRQRALEELTPVLEQHILPKKASPSKRFNSLPGTPYTSTPRVRKFRSLKCNTPFYPSSFTLTSKWAESMCSLGVNPSILPQLLSENVQAYSSYTLLSKSGRSGIPMLLVHGTVQCTAKDPRVCFSTAVSIPGATEVEVLTEAALPSGRSPLHTIQAAPLINHEFCASVAYDVLSGSQVDGGQTPVAVTDFGILQRFRAAGSKGQAMTDTLIVLYSLDVTLTNTGPTNAVNIFRVVDNAIPSSGSSSPKMPSMGHCVFSEAMPPSLHPKFWSPTLPHCQPEAESQQSDHLSSYSSPISTSFSENLPSPPIEIQAAEVYMPRPRHSDSITTSSLAAWNKLDDTSPPYNYSNRSLLLA